MGSVSRNYLKQLRKSSHAFFFRASAENVIDADFIHCFCFDSGNFKTLSLDKIRKLPNQFRKMPKLAMKAKLYGESSSTN